MDLFLNYYTISLFIGGFTALLSGIVVFLHNREKLENIAWFFLNISSSIWSFGYFAMIVTLNKNIAWISNTVLHIAAILIPIFYFLFILNLTKSFKKYRIFFYIISFIGFIFLILTPTSYFIIDVIPKFIFNYTPDAGPLYFYFMIYFFAVMIYSLIVLFINIKKNINIQERRRLKYVFLFTILGFIGGGSVFFLTFNINIPPYFIILFAIYPVVTAYAIVKHNLFDVKVIATELLTFALWIAVLIEVFLADTWTERFIEIGLLILVISFGILIIRSVLKEVHIREKIEGLAKELEYANKKLKEIDDQKTEFMSLASHQLRTPLTSIKGYTSMLESGDFGKINDNQKEPLDIIFTSTENMNNLIDDFLNASRIEKKRGFDYNFVLDNPLKLIKGIIDNLSIQAKEKGIKFIFENKINKEAKIKFDNRTLLQAISNLIQNAIKYTNKGTVEVKLSRTNNHLEISVKDSGIGMTSDDLKMLFKRFFRSDSVKVNHPEGTGLGLYLAERIIQDHGGKIWAESKGIGKGSAFFITLPVVEKG